MFLSFLMLQGGHDKPLSRYRVGYSGLSWGNGMGSGCCKRCRGSPCRFLRCRQKPPVWRAAFPKGNLYLKLRERIGTIIRDEDFVALFAKEGAPGLPPWRLALVTILQFHENLSNRQAAEAVRARIDWKYVLSLELTDEGFDFSVLSEFRARLIKCGLRNSS